MNKKTIRIAALALVLVIVLAAAGWLVLGGGKDEPIAQGNLLTNGDFSAVTGGMPDGWVTGMWVTSPGASYLEAASAPDGTSAVLVENVAPNDARFEQSVAVRENSTYRLTAKVMAEGCDESKMGANVSFLGIYGASEDVHDTHGEWETVELYAHTGKGQREATVCVRVGGYGSEASGKAYFTDVVLEQVESAPVGAFVLDLSTPAPQKEEKAEGEKGQNVLVIPGMLAVFAAYLALAFVLVRMLGPLGNVPRGAMPAMLVLAFALRLLIAFTVEGYGVDMGCFSAWAGKMASGGPANFYEEGYFCDYPPAYMLVLWLTGAVAKLFGITGGMGIQVLIKLSPIACDIALAALVYALVARISYRRAGLMLSALVAFNPAFIVTGAAWGQIDAVLALLLAVMLLEAKAGRWHIAIPVFALAVLAKPQAGLLAPLGVAALVKEIVNKETRKESAKRIGMGLAAGVAVTALIVIPFSVKQDDPFWLVGKYIETLSSYDYATLSTGNLMFLLGGNWVKNSEAVIFGITYGQLGMALMVLSFAAGIALYLTGKGRSRLMFSAAMTMQLVFVLGSKMHERYILPALILLLLAYLETADERMMGAFALASSASAVNIAVVLAFDYLIAPNLWLGYVLSVAQIIAAGLTVWAAVCAALGRAPMRLRVPEKKKADGAGEGGESDADRYGELLGRPLDHHMHMTRRDWALMLGITAVYAVVGFWHLGATKAPQTGYASTQAGEYAVFDLGEHRENFHIYYYGGISDTTFSFATSEDGESYTGENLAYFGRGECFKWLALRDTFTNSSGELQASGGMLNMSGRYLRVTFENAGASLWEIAAVDENGEPYPITLVASGGAREGREDDPAKLIDEQDAVPDVPSYYNSMYFDEIYHARTGYEHAHALSTYEWTHPPLGKVLMSWCIRLMGMTPFAWRFAGTLAGVLMLPAIYILAMQLFKRTKFAVFATLLLALDCMHFTQTRIATIDSFPVLFMMVMFLFMARWMQMNFLTQRLRDTLVPLALSGLFMGLAIASKWIGCYGAVGLALLFFARFITLCVQAAYANRHARESDTCAHAAAVFPKHAVLTLLWCVVFFVIVPVVIYGLSHIPYLRYFGPVKLNLESLRRIIDLQISMWNYHTDLNATHSFASMWYEWPVIAKPMWYYNADYKGAGMASSILSFGNPAVWWTGLVAIIFVLAYSAYRNAAPSLGLCARRRDELDRAMPVIAMGFLSAYLPWVLVARLTFIYHYFASVPFIILATAQAARYMERSRPRLTNALMVILVVIALVLFIGFYPLASGMEVPRAWCDMMNWFDNWMYY